MCSFPNPAKYNETFGLHIYKHMYYKEDYNKTESVII